MGRFDIHKERVPHREEKSLPSLCLEGWMEREMTLITPPSSVEVREDSEKRNSKYFWLGLIVIIFQLILAFWQYVLDFWHLGTNYPGRITCSLRKCQWLYLERPSISFSHTEDDGDSSRHALCGLRHGVLGVMIQGYRTSAFGIGGHLDWCPKVWLLWFDCHWSS